MNLLSIFPSGWPRRLAASAAGEGCTKWRGQSARPLLPVASHAPAAGASLHLSSPPDHPAGVQAVERHPGPRAARGREGLSARLGARRSRRSILTRGWPAAGPQATRSHGGVRAGRSLRCRGDGGRPSAQQFWRGVRLEERGVGWRMRQLFYCCGVRCRGSECTHAGRRWVFCGGRQVSSALGGLVSFLRRQPNLLHKALVRRTVN